MVNGMMVVNGFLHTAKFEELYRILLDSAERHGIRMTVRTNAQLTPAAAAMNGSECDFVLFWDKDVQLAELLEQQGLKVFNSSRSILWCDDKAQTYLHLRGKGIRIPDTVLAPRTFPNIGYNDLSFTEDVIRQLGLPLVMKECFGSFGHQVYLIRTADELKAKLTELAGTPVLFQRYIAESHGHDVRVNVVGGKVVAAIHRRSTDGDFRSNLTRGGAMEPYTPTQAHAEEAIRAVEALGLDFAGVDVLFANEGPMICEVNSNAHFKTTLDCTGVNMADAILEHILSKL